MPFSLHLASPVILTLVLLVAGDVERATDSGAAFPRGAAAEPLSASGIGGEGPAWDPEWGLLTTGKGRINRWAIDGTESVFREDAGTNGLLGNDDVERANGVLVSADDRFLFVTDNCNDRDGGSRTLWRFTLHPDGTLYRVRVNAPGRVWWPKRD